MGDVASAVEFASGVQRVAPGDRGVQFASDITDDSRQMFVAVKVNGLVIAYGRVMESAAGRETAPGTPAGYYLSGVLVAPAWRRRGIATALTRARLRWVFARADEAFYVAGADNIASLHLHTALGFQEMKRFPSDRSAAGVDVLSRLTRAAALSLTSADSVTGDSPPTAVRSGTWRAWLTALKIASRHPALAL